jgi:hypothetical protein
LPPKYCRQYSLVLCKDRHCVNGLNYSTVNLINLLSLMMPVHTKMEMIRACQNEKKTTALMHKNFGFQSQREEMSIVHSCSNTCLHSSYHWPKIRQIPMCSHVKHDKTVHTTANAQVVPETDINIARVGRDVSFKVNARELQYNGDESQQRLEKHKLKDASLDDQELDGLRHLANGRYNEHRTQINNVKIKRAAPSLHPMVLHNGSAEEDAESAIA